MEDQTKLNMDLAQVAHGAISQRGRALSVADLEHALLERYRREDAEAWDRMGLLVGDPAMRIGDVAVALDATSQAVSMCADQGANVLLTHHPVFLEPPATVRPPHAAADDAEAAVWIAVTKGVALMNVHTALDVHPHGNSMLPQMLNLEAEGVISPIRTAYPESSPKGYGRLCRVAEDERPMSLGQLASRCLSVFGRSPRVWGDTAARIEVVVAATGSAGGLAGMCLEAGVDCLICGEIRYHAALAAAQRGLAVVELGHDVSELPLTGVLAASAIEAGIDPECVRILDQSDNWGIPDAVRI